LNDTYNHPNSEFSLIVWLNGLNAPKAELSVLKSTHRWRWKIKMINIKYLQKITDKNICGLKMEEEIPIW